MMVALIAQVEADFGASAPSRTAPQRSRMPTARAERTRRRDSMGASFDGQGMSWSDGFGMCRPGSPRSYTLGCPAGKRCFPALAAVEQPPERGCREVACQALDVPLFAVQLDHEGPDRPRARGWAPGREGGGSHRGRAEGGHPFGVRRGDTGGWYPPGPRL